MSTVAVYSIRDTGAFAVSVAETPAGATEVSARATCYSVEVESHHRFDALHIRSENGEHWVEARRIESSSTWLRNTDGRLRLTVSRLFRGTSRCALHLARAKEAGWSNLFNASITELSEIAGVNVSFELRSAGAFKVGTRKEVLGDAGPRRRTLCATFSTDDQRSPVLALLLTRALPLVRARV